MKEKKLDRSLIRIKRGDITDQSTDAIVNAANKRLAPGGGVAGAIHRAAGPQLWEECKTLGGCKTGEAKITRGYHLKASFVIHTVGPIYSGCSMDAKQLASCFRNSLLLGMKHDLKSISFPAISTGVFGYPIKKAAHVSIKTVYDFLLQRNTSLSVQFVLFDAHSLQVFEEIFDEIVE
jgi:O-acetyl-ADP-ribose deacetylase (regulator of RNase III)